jgi:hypothetical protein
MQLRRWIYTRGASSHVNILLTTDMLWRRCSRSLEVKQGITPTELYTVNSQAREVNERELRKLKTPLVRSILDDHALMGLGEM